VCLNSARNQSKIIIFKGLLSTAFTQRRVSTDLGAIEQALAIEAVTAVVEWSR
jgi:hypothetical protein